MKAATERFRAQLRAYPPNEQALLDAGVLTPDDLQLWEVVPTGDETEPEYRPVDGRCAGIQTS